DLVQIIARDFADVFAVIAVLREFRRFAEQFLRTGAHRDGEVLDLLTRVVVIELARDLVALRLQQRGNGVAERGLTAVAHMQRAGRIGRHEFHDHRQVVADRRTTVVRAFLPHYADDLLLGDRLQADIDEAGAGDVDAFDPLGRRQRGDQFFGHLARRHFQRAGELHGDRAGVIAVVRLL